MTATDDFPAKLLRYLLRLVPIPNATTETVECVRAIEAAMAAQSQPAPAAAPPPITPRVAVGALAAEHVTGARVFANRTDAPEMIRPSGHIAEIGVALCDFTETMLRRLAPVRFDAFDLFRLQELEALWGRTSHEWFEGWTHRAFYERRFASEIAASVLHVHEGDSAQTLERLPDASCDTVYVDGDHSYEGALRGAEVCVRKLKADDLLIFNDYTMADHLTGSPYGAVPVVNSLCVEYEWGVVYIAQQPDMFCDIGLWQRS